MEINLWRSGSINQDVFDLQISFDITEILVEICRSIEWSFACRFHLGLVTQVLCVVIFPIFDLGYYCWLEPKHTTSLFPYALLTRVFVRIRIGADSILFPVDPVSFKLSAIGPLVYSEAFLFILDKLAEKHYAIFVLVDSVTMHIVV